jgi:Domain of unknown function (DUF4124)
VCIQLIFLTWVRFNPEIITTGMIAMSKFLLILLMLASANAFAAISKWVDAQGQIHYSDQPPPADAKAKTLHSAPDTGATAGASGVPAPKTIAEREAELKKAQKAQKETADKAAKKQANEEAIKANCATAQQSLRTLQEGTPMVEVDANGERSFIDDTQRQQRIAKIQRDIDTNCK